jgi:hypothetical protein
VIDDRLQRIVRILGGLRGCFDDHASRCDHRVVAIALSDSDWEELQIAEIWGLPVLAWEDVQPGRVQLLCEANCMLIPPYDNLADLQDVWNYRLQPPRDPEVAA